MKRLLVLNFFPAFVPPRSGGEHRYYYLYDALSKFYDVTLLSPTYPDRRAELVTFRPTFREYRIPKEDVHVRLHRRLAQQGTGPECSALVCALASAEETAYLQKYRELVREADAVIHESPYMLNYDPNFHRDDKPRVYNSYNVEAQLAAHMFPDPQGRPYVDFIAHLERSLVQGCALVFATCETERDVFRDDYGCPEERLVLAPNGFHPRAIVRREQAVVAATKRRLGLDPERLLAIFVGSAHSPNGEAARFILDRLSPALPAVQVAIAGSVCSGLASPNSNVHLLGVVTDDVKTSLYEVCDVALNPVVSGAGTNVKLLDYMAAGLPVVTTPFGARGVPLQDRQHCIVADWHAFPTALESLLADRPQRERLGRAAAELAHKHFSWPTIADAVRRRLDLLFLPEARGNHGPRLRLLLLNDFPVSVARHGGEVRIHQLFRRLSRHYEVTILCLYDDVMISELPITEHFKEIRIPKTDVHRTMEREWNSRYSVSTSDILTSTLCIDNRALVAEYRRLLGQSDVVILQHPYLAPLVNVERPRVPVLYEALNVEVLLKAQTLRMHPDRAHLLQQVDAVEERACAIADRIICVSEEDRKVFAQRVEPAKLAVVLNGVDCRPHLIDGRHPAGIRKVLRGGPVAVFIGSGHPPNVEALRFIVEELAPLHPGVIFLAIGSSCDAIRSAPRNVLLCGQVSDREKKALLRLADIALNPMQSGGGSSLKVAEYFAAGLPVLSTAIGLRGYDDQMRLYAMSADLTGFSDRLATLLSDRTQLAELGLNAQHAAHARLDWDVLADSYRGIISGVPLTRKKRLLVSTFRFTDPPRGGAETYLLELLKHLHAGGHFIIDVATFNVGAISNHLHFAASYEAGSHATPTYVNRVYGFAPAPLRQRDVFDHCKRLFALWQEEDLIQGRRFVDRFHDAVLLGGWHALEQHDARPLRWTGERAEIYCPAHLCGLTISGLARGRTRLRATFEGHVLINEVVRGSFSLDFDLRAHRAGILQLRTQARIRGRDDPRRLGVCITGITQIAADGRTAIPLERDFESILRSSDLETWVESLIAATRRTEPEDSRFLSVRGPSARDFEDWLNGNLTGYDVVLAHGAPFAPAVTTATLARRARVPCAMLPHFHFDDKYYHWQSYYQALAGADIVFAFPDSSKPYFYDKIKARALCVPGGGVRPEEFDQLDASIRKFRQMHRSTRPFLLVLGRKAGAKQYGRIGRAVECIRSRGQPCDLVMIGPDEDSLPITSDGVSYYGNQPRDVVLGALACCTCLVTMSDSESFGIVLVEAWMCRKPVIANGNCPAFAELVDHELDGLLCRTDDELVAAIVRLLIEPELGHQLGARGYAKALSRYTWGQIAASIGEALASIAR